MLRKTRSASDGHGLYQNIISKFGKKRKRSGISSPPDVSRKKRRGLTDGSTSKSLPVIHGRMKADNGSDTESRESETEEEGDSEEETDEFLLKYAPRWRLDRLKKEELTRMHEESGLGETEDGWSKSDIIDSIWRLRPSTSTRNSSLRRTSSSTRARSARDENTRPPLMNGVVRRRSSRSTVMDKGNPKASPNRSVSMGELRGFGLQKTKRTKYSQEYDEFGHSRNRVSRVPTLSTIEPSPRKTRSGTLLDKPPAKATSKLPQKSRLDDLRLSPGDDIHDHAEPGRLDPLSIRPGRPLRIIRDCQTHNGSGEEILASRSSRRSESSELSSPGEQDFGVLGLGTSTRHARRSTRDEPLPPPVIHGTTRHEQSRMTSHRNASARSRRSRNSERSVMEVSSGDDTSATSDDPEDGQSSQKDEEEAGARVLRNGKVVRESQGSLGLTRTLDDDESVVPNGAESESDISHDEVETIEISDDEVADRSEDDIEIGDGEHEASRERTEEEEDDDEDDEDYEPPASEMDVEGIAHENMRTLLRKSRGDLVKLCEANELTVEGNKKDLANALLKWRDSNIRSSPPSYGTERAPSQNSTSNGQMTPRRARQSETPILLRDGNLHISPVPPTPSQPAAVDKETDDVEIDLESLGLVDREIPFEKITKGEKIGSGGFKDVFIGRYRNKKVAIAEFRGTLSAMDIKELKLLREFDHPNVVRFFGVSIPEDSRTTPVMIVSELCPNGDLFDYIRNTSAPTLYRLLKLMLGIAKGLQYLHKRKPSVIHRDCKSSNILITAKLEAKITDFGLAKVKQTTRSMIKSLVGTVNWQAPELWHPHPKYDHKVDVFSCAMVYWEMLQWHLEKKQYPWEGMNEHAIYEIVGRKGQRPSLSGMRKRWCPEVVELVERMWTQDARDRPGIDSVVEDVAAIVEKYAPH